LFPIENFAGAARELLCTGIQKNRIGAFPTGQKPPQTIALFSEEQFPGQCQVALELRRQLRFWRMAIQRWIGVDLNCRQADLLRDFFHARVSPVNEYANFFQSERQFRGDALHRCRIDSGSRLAPLADLADGPRARLTETLAAWLDRPGQVQAVAAALDVHPQTVRYRVRQLRDLFGERLEDPEARFELALALRAR